MTTNPRVMLIAGGSGSIGREIATEAVASGWRVAVHGRDATRVASVIERLRKPGAVAVGFVEDLVRPDATASLVARVGDRFMRIDAVVDCVSGGPQGITGPFAQTDPAAYAALADASIVHFERLAHATLPWLSSQGGALIAFASDAGRFAAPRQALIGASRAAIIGFVRNLALEVAREGVRVHCISPSFVEGSASLERASPHAASRLDNARMRAGLGLPTAADIAPLVLFLCSDGARRMTGQVLSVNGGLNA